MPKRRQSDTFAPGDRVRVLSWTDGDNRGTVVRKSPRPDMYDVRSVSGKWSGTFFATSLVKDR